VAKKKKKGGPEIPDNLRRIKEGVARGGQTVGGADHHVNGGKQTTEWQKKRGVLRVLVCGY